MAGSSARIASVVDTRPLESGASLILTYAQLLVRPGLYEIKREAEEARLALRHESQQRKGKTYDGMERVAARDKRMWQLEQLMNE